MQDQMLTKATGFKQTLEFPLFNHAHGLTVSQQFVAGGIGTEVIGVIKNPDAAVIRLGIRKAKQTWITK